MIQNNNNNLIMSNNNLTIQQVAVTRFLAVIAIIIHLISFGTRFLVYFTDYKSVFGLNYFIHKMYVGNEQNIPTMFSIFLLMFASALLLLITTLKWKKPKSYYLSWMLLCLGFFYLAMDEAMSLHETVLNHQDGVLLGHQFSGFLYHAWIIPFVLMIPFLIVIFSKFLINLDKKTRILFIVSGAIFVGGAIGVESIGGYIKENIGVDNWWYYIEEAVEEALEMAGVIIFIYALLGYLAENYKSINFSLVK